MCVRFTSLSMVLVTGRNFYWDGKNEKKECVESEMKRQRSNRTRQRNSEGMDTVSETTTMSMQLH